MRRLFPLIACVLILLAGTAPAAVAKTSSHKSTSSSSSHTLSPTPPSSNMATGTSTSSDAPSGALPYTGLDLWASVAVASGLLGAGLVLRRLAAAR